MMAPNAECVRFFQRVYGNTCTRHLPFLSFCAVASGFSLRRFVAADAGPMLVAVPMHELNRRCAPRLSQCACQGRSPTVDCVVWSAAAAIPTLLLKAFTQMTAYQAAAENSETHKTLK